MILCQSLLCSRQCWKCCNFHLALALSVYSVLCLLKNIISQHKQTFFYLQKTFLKIAPNSVFNHIFKNEIVIQFFLLVWWWLTNIWASRVVLVVKNLPANTEDIRDAGLISGSGRSLGGGHSNPLQYSCLENSMDRGAWRATVYEAAKSWTWLKWLSMHECNKYIFLSFSISFI